MCLFTRQPTKITSSLREICKRANNLKQAFESLGSYFALEKNTPHFSPEEEAYAPVLELCAHKKALFEGKQIHAHVITSIGEVTSVFLRTKLVFMYGKCGAVVDARKLFDEMYERSVFSWNAMMGGYVSNGQPSEVIRLYGEMRMLGVSVDAFTFPSVLKACGLVRDLRIGSEVHGYAYKTGCDSNGFVVNALVSMYAKCEDTVSARRLFDRMEERDDVVLWNSMISAYSGDGKRMEALMLFREMHNAGVGMNTYTYVAALQACEELSLGNLGTAIHAMVVKSDDHMHVYVANALLGMYTKCKRMGESSKKFRMMVEKDGISWNSMLSGFVQNGLYNEAIELFREMMVAGHEPDQVSLISIIGGSARLKKLLNGMEAHAYAIKIGSDADVQVSNSLIDMYAKCCCVNYMEHVFLHMLNRDSITWTSIISGYAQNNCHMSALNAFREARAEKVIIDARLIGSVLLACASLKQINLVKEIHGYIVRNQLIDKILSNALVDAYGECGNLALASQLFELIKYKDIISWTCMISIYADAGLGNEALSLFRSMKEDGTTPDFVALVSVLSAAASLSALNKGKEIHGFIVRNGFLLQGTLASSHVDMYARCGSPEYSSKVFDHVKDKDIVLWTCMIHSKGMHGNGEMAIELFDQMERENVAPDHVTFLALLYACSHSGLTEEGQKYLNIMQHKYNLEPWPDHYACVVDLLGRANSLEEAYRFVKSMPIDPNAVIWKVLLGACHVHSNQELGEIAAKKLLSLEPDNPGNYVLASNVFAATGKWDKADQVREKMRERGLKKTPACSWIEIRDKVHTFMASDNSHPQHAQIYEKLAQIIEILEKEGGYVAQTKYVYRNMEEEKKIVMLYGHSERLAIAYGLLQTPRGTPIRVTKNLRICGDCHVFIELVSKYFDREIVVRDASRFHHFRQGRCSCGDFW